MNLTEVIRLITLLCLKYEGIYLKPYLCPAGVWTIGVGATYYENGIHVTGHDAPITKERALQLLDWHVRNVYLPQVIKLCPGANTPSRLAALGDFAFNLGTGNLKISTLRKKVNVQDWVNAVVQIKKWDKAGGKKLRGLTLRREAEALLLAA